MAFKYIKCPECGETMKLEADKDLIFCEYCEAKIKNEDIDYQKKHIRAIVVLCAGVILFFVTPGGTIFRVLAALILLEGIDLYRKER